MISIATKAKRSLLGVFGVLILVLSTALTASATHYAAADIFVEYIGNGPGHYKYRVTYYTFKVCEPQYSQASLSDFESYSVSSPSGCSPFTANRSIQFRAKDTLDQLCPASKPFNACRTTDTTLPAFVRHTYSDTITLPSACTDWTFVWTSGSRNGGINNLVNPSGQNIYVACQINNVAKYNNSSPRFTADPFPYVCANQQVSFLNAPLDPNNDSMFVSSYQPRGAGGATLNYAPGYSLANPINSSTPYAVDPATGTATFNSTAQGKYVLSYRVTEYDRFTGVQLGYTERDIQVIVFPCAAPPPSISPAPINITGGNVVSQQPSASNVVTICPGAAISFNIGTRSKNGPTGQVYLSSNDGLVTPGSIFMPSGQGTDTVSATYSWTPTPGDVGEHTLIFTTTDSTCGNGSPIVLKNYTVVLIKVPTDIAVDSFGFYCPNGGAGYQINVRAPATSQFVWSVIGPGTVNSLSCPNCPNPIARPDSTTTYQIEIPANPFICKRKDTVTVVTNNVSILNGAEAVLCRPGYLQLDAVASGPKPLQKIACGINTFAVCTTQDTAQVGVNNVTTTVQTPFNSYYSTARTQLLYRRDELMAGALPSSTIRTIGFYVTGTPTTSFGNFNLKLKCTPTQTLTTAAGFENGTTTVFTANSVSVAPGWNYFPLSTPYNWDTTQNLLADICFTNASPTYTLSPGVQYTATAYNSVLYAYNYSGSVCQFVGSGGGGPFVSGNRANIRFGFCKPDTVGYKYTWKGSSYLSDSSIINPIAYVPRTVTYNIYAEGKDGCQATDKITILVPTDSFSVSPTDTAICYGEGVLLQASLATRYTWYENGYNTPTTLSCINCPQTIAKPLVNTVYTLVSSNLYGSSNTECPDSNTVSVIVKPLPIVNVSPRDTTVKYGRAVRLLATGANLYYWTPALGLNSPVGTSIFATVEDSAITYTVTGLAENGCRDTATARVGIDYRDNLLVPTAFTPNGDRINDEFKIANFSFQKLQEFRVFNRWGQEIFSTNDGTKGWDGTWKGVEQTSGVYQYIIRVAFPDGITETYKGNVTLIR